jgi:histidyl-tRNA synthetase
MMTVNIPPGTFDIIPSSPQEEWRNSFLWNYVETVIRDIARSYGYQEIRTPIFERTELFLRGVGEATDIVSKEMYMFKDKGDRSMTLRPEGTAPVIRAFIENQLQNQGSIHKLFYIGPMFRYDRPQAGRYRQFHHFGAEAIGNRSPEQDVEIIEMSCTIHKKLGLKNLTLYINSIGDTESRLNFRKALQDYLKQYFDELSTDSKQRFETNPLRILDSKDPKDQELVASAPSILDYLSETSKAHFESIKKLLDSLHISYQVNSRLVRGLDYYNETVFEVVAGELGAQNSICGGGRYDGLMKKLGGPDLPTIGFACGLERVIQTLLKQEAPLPKQEGPTLYLIPLGEAAKTTCFSLLSQLRSAGIAADMDFAGRKLNKSMQYANTIQARYTAVIGDDEIQAGEVELKEMASGEKHKFPLSRLAQIIQLEKKNEAFLDLWQQMSKPFESPEEAEFFAGKLKKSINQAERVSDHLQQALSSIQHIIKQ